MMRTNAAETTMKSMVRTTIQVDTVRFQNGTSREDVASRCESSRGVATQAETAARQIEANSSTFRLAPPIRPPSTSGAEKSSAAFAAFTDPP